tara:strand:- start:4077 stop:4754 length:678 start_codon:yes stop_codon:yes gene_type:complete
MKIEYKTQDVLAVAFRAFKINNGYIKDTVRFSEPTNNTVFSNKDLVKFQMRPEFRPPDFVAMQTDTNDYSDVDSALKHFRRYTFGMLGETLTDFQKDVIENVWSETVEFNKLGILAYVPALVERELKENSLKKVIRTEYRESKYIAGVGESVEGVCKILDRHYSSHYERYKYTADYMGNIIGFWNKFEIPVGEHRKFKGKVKSHDKNRLFEVNETSINYVKIYKV